MNMNIFLSIIAWAGLCFFGIRLLLSVISFYYFELTEAGRYELLFAGQKVTSYKFVQSLVVVVICVAAIFAL